MGLLDQMLANLYQPSKQEKPLASSAKAALSAGKTVPASQFAQTTVAQGQFLRGEVLDLRANQILVLLENGATVSARTEGLLNLSIGETARFFVAQTTEDQILLKHVKEEGSAEHPMIDKALTAAGITRTEKSVSIVSELLSHSQPVTEANIRHYLSLSAKYPELPVKDFILMELHEIPVNAETVSQFASYHDGNGKLLSLATNLLTELQSQIETLPDGEGKQQFLQELATICTDSSAGTENTRSPGTMTQPFADATPPSSDAVPHSFDGGQLIGSGESMSQSTEYVPQETSATGALPQTPPEGITPDSSNVQSPTAPSGKPPAEPSVFLKDFLDSFLLTPEEVADADKVKNYYEDLNQKIETLNQFALKLAEHTKETAVATPKQMKSNLSFMESVNQVFPFLQLPLKLTESPAHGELYVYERKKALKPSDSFSALLHLDLEALGSMDVFITLAGQNVTSRFSLTDKTSAELIRTELPALSESLAKKGYSLTSDVTVTEPDPTEHTPTLLEQFLEEHAPGGLTRYTFDIRA